MKSPKPPKKLVFVVDEYPLPIGGMETHAFECIKFFSIYRQIRFEGIIGFSSKRDKIRRENDKKGSHHVNVAIFPKGEIYEGKKIVAYLRGLGMGAGDIIFFNSLYWIRIFPLLKKQFPASQFILRSGGNDIAQSHIEGAGKTLAKRRRFVVDSINANIDTLIVNSNYSYALFRGFGIRARLMRIVTGGVDVKRFSPIPFKQRALLRNKLGFSSNQKIILSACRLVEWKGLAYTLEAIAKIRDPNIIHLIIGSGPYAALLRKKIQTLGLREKVSFRSFVPPSAIAPYFKIADVYCHTPVRYMVKVEGGSYVHTETMGRSYCEALACGVPVVATNVGGIKDVVRNGTTGFLTKEKDVVAIFAALRTLLDDGHRYKKISLNARTYAVKNLSWDKVWGEYEKIFSK